MNEESSKFFNENKGGLSGEGKEFQEKLRGLKEDKS